MKKLLLTSIATLAVLSTIGISASPNRDLQIALRKNDFKAAKAALKKGATIHSAVLFRAIMEKNLPKVKFLVNHGEPDILESRMTAEGLDGTPLLFAAEFGNPAIVQFLVNEGADLNPNANFSPLGRAILRRGAKKFYMAKFLYNKGARLNQNDKTLMHQANHQQGRRFYRRWKQFIKTIDTPERKRFARKSITEEKGLKIKHQKGEVTVPGFLRK